ncbi:MAG TPA: ABC transporter permease [Terriglobales bacterium]|nr:ABC transporter permease [Terriglobales bacterium]
MRPALIFDFFRRDLAYTIRSLRKNPAFALTAIVTLAVGIGANTAIFTIVRSILLRPLAYRQPERLVEMTPHATPIRFDELKKSVRSYTDIGDYFVQDDDVALTGAFTPEVIKQARVSANFLSILGVEPLIGRSFTAEEDSPAGPPVVIISSNLWQRRFGGDPQIVGHTIDVAGFPHTVVGIMPADFKFPFPDADVWFPQPAKDVTQFSPLLAVFGRLAPGVTLAQATAELQVVNAQYAAAHPGMLDARRDKPARVAPLKESLVANVRGILWMLFGAVTFVLLIACANVAGLLLARATSRSREFAVRAALGASRSRVIAQLLIESTTLSLLASVLGTALAQWMLHAVTLASLTRAELPRIGEVRLDPWVLAFTLILSVATGVVFGLLPSFTVSRPDLVSALKSRAESGVSSRSFSSFNMRSALVAGQVALSIVLLSGTALLIRSLVRLSRVDPGFDSANLLTFRVSLSPAHYSKTESQAAFYDEVLRRIDSVPGVKSSTISLTLPMMGYPMMPVQPADAPVRKLNERQLGMIQFITPDYLRTLRIPLRRGREFNQHDKTGAPPVTIINEALARKLWPDYPQFNPIGRRILMGVRTTQFEIVGVVGDIRQGLDTDATPSMYWSAYQTVSPTMMFAVRTEGNPLRYAEEMRRAVLAVDPAQPISAIHTITELAEQEEGQRRVVLLVLGAFAIAAVLLTMIGIYGTITYWVVQRTGELGIRRALGAPTGNILWLVVGRGLALTAAGLVIGIAAAIGLTRLMQSLLFQVSPTDLPTLGAVGVITVALSLIASYLPARRAVRVNPMQALRAE